MISFNKVHSLAESHLPVENSYLTLVEPKNLGLMNLAANSTAPTDPNEELAMEELERKLEEKRKELEEKKRIIEEKKQKEQDAIDAA